MASFWRWMKQSHIRILSSQLNGRYPQVNGSSLVTQTTVVGVVNNPCRPFYLTGFEFGKNVRFFASPVQVKTEEETKDKGLPRMNEKISAQFVRLVTDEGHCVVSRHEALERARRLKVDLVEVQPDGKPPVCKLMDYKKEMYMRQVKEKENTKKKKSELVLRNGALKEVRLTCKIDKKDLQTKADTVKRLTERGYRVKCMVVGKEDEDLGGLLSSISILLEDFSLVESGPIVEAKQAFIVVRHVKYGPLRKGLKKVVEVPQEAKTSTQSPETSQQSLDTEESNSKTEDILSQGAAKSYAADEQEHRIASENRFAATSQKRASAPVSENRCTPSRQTNASAPGTMTPSMFEVQSRNPRSNPQLDLNSRGSSREPKHIDTEAAGSSSASSYGMFSTLKTNNDPQRESGPAEVNRYKKGPNKTPPLNHDNRGAPARGRSS